MEHIILFETGSAKWLRFLDDTVQFVSDRNQATAIKEIEVAERIARYRLRYCEHTLEIQPAESARPETALRGKMSPQDAVGYGNWPDEDGRQTKHGRFSHQSRRGPGKEKSIRTHRDGSRG